MPNNTMLFKPASQEYPSSYDQSVSEIDLKCDCHKGWISGHAKRVGMVESGNYPVYKIFGSRFHPDLIDTRIALTPTGFVNPIHIVTTARTRNQTHVRK